MTSSTITALGSHLTRAMRWLKIRSRGWRTRSSRQLRVCETVALGERRFVAVIEFAQQKFLIGGAGHTVAMLAPLTTPPAAQPGKEGEDEVQTFRFDESTRLVEANRG